LADRADDDDASRLMAIGLGGGSDIRVLISLKPYANFGKGSRSKQQPTCTVAHGSIQGIVWVVMLPLITHKSDERPGISQELSSK
jgi:hypothetical protein